MTGEQLTARQKVALRVLERGGTRPEAASAAGISIATLARWARESSTFKLSAATAPADNTTRPGNSWAAYDK